MDFRKQYKRKTLERQRNSFNNLIITNRGILLGNQELKKENIMNYHTQTIIGEKSLLKIQILILKK